MTNTAYGRASMAYRASGLLIHEPATIALALHQKLYAAVTSASLAGEQNRLDEMTNHVQTATSLLTAMRMHMNFDLAGADGRRLAEFYRRLQRQIVAAGMLREGSPEWSNITAQIRNVMLGLSKATNRQH
jgi:flagellin-specific chaperone FliS